VVSNVAMYVKLEMSDKIHTKFHKYAKVVIHDFELDK